MYMGNLYIILANTIAYHVLLLPWIGQVATQLNHQL